MRHCVAAAFFLEADDGQKSGSVGQVELYIAPLRCMLSIMQATPWCRRRSFCAVVSKSHYLGVNPPKKPSPVTFLRSPCGVTFGSTNASFGSCQGCFSAGVGVVLGSWSDDGMPSRSVFSIDTSSQNRPRRRPRNRLLERLRTT